jgi:hypothetical protein
MRDLTHHCAHPPLILPQQKKREGPEVGRHCGCGHEEPEADLRRLLEEEAWTTSEELEAGTAGPVTINYCGEHEGNQRSG